MTIAVVSAASSIHTVRWVNAFAGRGHTVHLITLHEPIQGIDPAVELHPYPFHGGAGYVLQGPKVKRLLADIAPDVVNVHYATGYGTLARSCTDWPLVINVWGSDVFDFPEKSAMHRRLVESTWRRQILSSLQAK